MLRHMIAGIGLVLAWAVPAFALKQVDQDGYIYLNISLEGLWGGFFFFLFSIFFVLVGLFLFFIWRRVDRKNTHTPLSDDREEEDEQVF